MVALRSSPFKLTYPDTSYVAGAPLPRGAPVLVGFVFALASRLLALMLIVALVAVALLQPGTIASATRTSLDAAAGTIPLAVFSWGLAWLVGCARMTSHDVERRRVLWLAPLAVLVPAFLVPAALLWPGRTLVLAMGGQVSARVLFLAALAVLAAGALAWVGNRVNMTLVAEESVLYARLKDVGGFMLLFRDPMLVRQIRAQEKLRAKTLRGRLPRAYGIRAIAARAVLAGLRHPIGLAWPLLWGAAITRAGAFLLLTHAHAQVWAYWLIAVVITAPRSLVTAFKADVAEPFLRQFLPVNALKLLFADAALPFALLLAGTLTAWVGQHAAPSLVLGGAALSLALALVLVLCQGAGQVPLGDLRFHVSPAVATATSFGIAIATGLLTKTLVVPLGIAAGTAAMLGSLVASSP